MGSTSLQTTAQDSFRTFWLPLLLLGSALGVSLVISTGLGFIAVGWGDVLRILASRFPGGEEMISGMDPLFPTVVMEVRLPRIITAAIVGGGLAVSGVIFQGILLNPLAEPYTLGVSAGAALGAALALILGLDFLGAYSITLTAFTGAVLTLLFVLYLASSAGGVSSGSLILSGIIVAAILSAGISFLKFWADEQVAVIIFWLMGSFASRTWLDAGATLIFVGLGSGVGMIYARDLNLMALGERTAASMGVNIRRVPLVLLTAASLLAAACVAVAGIIGFVGLLVPHMVRLMTGPDTRKLLPLSLLAGALLLLWADTLTRAILPVEIPIGVLTALIGGPVFCYIFRKRQTSGRQMP
jgi:iron complex transport system permease protein